VAHSEGDIRTGGDGNVIQGTHKCVVQSPGLPFSNLRQDGDGFIRAAEDKASNHWGVTWVSIREVEPIHDFVNEHSLGVTILPPFFHFSHSCDHTCL